MGIWAEIKYALNSTLGREDFAPLNELIIGAIKGEEHIFSTPGNFSLEIPSYITEIQIIAAGGGGGGARGIDRDGGVGGNGGGCVSKTIKVTGGTTITGKIGAGGKGGNDSDGTNTGLAGEATVINSILTVPGANIGQLDPVAGGGAGGDAGDVSLDMVASKGENGLFGKGGSIDTANKNYAGGGGGGSYGNGGNGGSRNNPNGANGKYGGGGGGGYGETSGRNGSGGNGGDGVVIIRWGGSIR